MYSKAAFVACALVALAAAPVSFAQTAPADAGQAPLSTSGAKATDENIAHFLNDKDAAAEAANGPDSSGAPAVVRDKAPHGEVGFSVGTNGYREAYGVVTMPLGEHGSATVAIDQSRMNYRGRDLNGRSLALRLALGDVAGRGPLLTPDDVCDIHRTGARGFEPYWMTRMRQDQLAQRGRACPD